jgi:DNA-binding CsgD family transcriptional regulator
VYNIRGSSYLSRMPRLSGSDYRKALDVVYEAADVDGPNPFPEPVLEALRRLVPCDVVAFHERVGWGAAVVWVGEPRGAMTPAIRDASRRYWTECPLTPHEAPRKFSDFLSQREFHRLGLYQECARPLGVEDVFRVWLDARGGDGARLEFDRGQRDFHERDRAVLDLLLPHLARHHRRVGRHRRRVDGARVRLTPREAEIIELVAEGRSNAEVAQLTWISPDTVRKHLENAYEKLGVHTRTAAVAALFGRGELA